MGQLGIIMYNKTLKNLMVIHEGIYVKMQKDNTRLYGVLYHKFQPYCYADWDINQLFKIAYGNRDRDIIKL